MAKLLFISNIAKRVGSFSVASIAAAKKIGFEYYYAANWSATPIEQRNEDENKFGIKLVNIDLNRSPYSSQNIKAYKQLVQFINENKIDYIHCNTPVGGILGRLAGEKCHVKKVIYQAHGFHFYKGAPKKNWLIYYPIEKWLAKKTDAIITINKEDYECAKRFTLRNKGKVYYVPGVGINLSNFENNQNFRYKKRTEMSINDSTFVILSVGELNKNKNNEVIIKALSEIHEKNILYLMCGVGDKKKVLENQIANLGLNDRIKFLGYRTDVKDLMCASDLFVMPSLREGLSRSLMEAMACSLPCVVSKIRGNSDLIQDDRGGYLVSAKDTEGFTKAINNIINNPNLRVKMGKYNLNRINSFSLNKVVEELIGIYKNL